MGMNNQNPQLVEQGFNLFEDVLGYALPEENNRGTDYANDFEERAMMMELDAEGRAAAQERDASREARDTREFLEKERAKSNATWGQSGLAMSGSKELVRDAQHHNDLQDEKDVIFQGQQEARATRDKGMREANTYRINQGIAPNRSTLSMGSSIYKYGRK